MIARIAAVTLAALALSGCSGSSEQARLLTLKALDLECLHTEMLFADLVNDQRASPNAIALNSERPTGRNAPDKLRLLTGEVIEIFSTSPGEHAELARVARELFIVAGEAQEAMKRPGARSSSNLVAAAAAIQRMRQLQERLSSLSRPAVFEPLPQA